MLVAALERIRPNPFQTRLEYDPHYILELAEDIVEKCADGWERTRGLMQLPLARIVDADGKPVDFQRGQWTLAGDITGTLEEHDWYAELAFGHNRWKAFQRLAAGDVERVFEQRSTWERFPLQYGDLADEAMATAAWSENAKRKDLTPIEEAQAIVRALEHFGWPQAELAERWGVSASAISNKKRLLRLPEEVQEMVDEGEISERQAMAMLPAFELPEAAQERVKNKYWNYERLLGNARAGTSSTRLRDEAGHVISSGSCSLDREGHYWSLDEDFGTLGVGGVRAGKCSECPAQFVYKGENLCGDYECYKRKLKLWKDNRLAQAMMVTGLDIAPEGLSYSERYRFFNQREAGARAYEHGCENLHIEWAGEDFSLDRGYHLDDLGFPDVRIVCVPGEDGECECLGEFLGVGEEDGEASVDAQAGVSIKAQRWDEVADLLDRAAFALVEGLRNDDSSAWRLLLDCVSRGHNPEQDDLSIGELQRLMALRGIKYLSNTAYELRDKPARARESIACIFERCGLSSPFVDPLTPLELHRKSLDRIQGWVFDVLLGEREAEAEAVRGNLKNLDDLASAVLREEPAPAREELVQEIRETGEMLMSLEDRMEDSAEYTAEEVLANRDLLGSARERKISVKGLDL